MPINPQRPLRILHVCKALPHSYKSGIQTHVWKLTEWQMKMGHEVSILSAGSIRKGYRKLNMGGRTIYEIPYPPARHIPIIPLFSEEYLFNLFARKWMKKHAQEFDVIHLQNRSGYLCAKVAHKLGVPVVTTFHGLLELEYKYGGNNVTNWLDRKLHNYFTAQFHIDQVKHSDAVISVSHSNLEFINKLYNNGQSLDKGHVIYNGIDRPELDPSIEVDPNLMVFVGRVVEIKGLFPLLETMRNVNNTIKLCIIGEGAAEEPLKKLATEYGLEDRVQFTGALEPKEVYKWIQKSSLLVLPSFYETQGIVLMEANICGKPVVATDIPGPNEVVIPGKNGWLVPVDDKEAMSDAINKIFDNPEEAKKMGAWGKDFAEDKFSWEQITRITLDLYQDLVPASVNKKIRSIKRGEKHLRKQPYSTVRI